MKRKYIVHCNKNAGVAVLPASVAEIKAAQVMSWEEHESAGHFKRKGAQCKPQGKIGKKVAFYWRADWDDESMRLVEFLRGQKAAVEVLPSKKFLDNAAKGLKSKNNVEYSFRSGNWRDSVDLRWIKIVEADGDDVGGVDSTSRIFFFNKYFFNRQIQEIACSLLRCVVRNSTSSCQFNLLESHL